MAVEKWRVDADLVATLDDALRDGNKDLALRKLAEIMGIVVLRKDPDGELHKAIKAAEALALENDSCCPKAKALSDAIDKVVSAYWEER